jgi:MFS family permease
VFESAVVKSAQKAAAPAWEALRSRPGGIAIGAGLRLGENISYYIITAVSITYATEVAHISRAAALNALLVGAAAECVTMPLFSALSDRVGRRWVFAIGAGGMGIWAFAFFRLLDTGATWPIIAAMVVGLVLHGAMYGPQAAFVAELFPTRFRYSGASITYHLTSVFAGSLAPIIALWLLRRTGSTTAISIYFAGACAISLFAALKARETRGQSYAVIDAAV